jgi:hypothetical protein
VLDPRAYASAFVSIKQTPEPQDDPKPWCEVEAGIGGEFARLPPFMLVLEISSSAVVPEEECPPTRLRDRPAVEDISSNLILLACDEAMV